MREGQTFEVINQIIQEVFKDSPETEILYNFKIENRSGRKREIDILIVGIINGIEIKIAIECKDYKNKVSVEKIEAFNSKCLRIPSINKMIFISKKGFQKDAINAANEFGIELYKLENIDEEEVKKWMIVALPKPVNVERRIEGLQIVAKVPIPEFNGNDLVFLPGDKKGIQLYLFLQSIIEERIPMTPLIPVIQGERLEEKRILITIDLIDTLLEINGEKYPIVNVQTTLIESYSPLKSDVTISRYKKFNTDVGKADIITYEIENKEIYSMVKRNDSSKIEIVRGGFRDGFNKNKFQIIGDLKIEKLN